MCKWLHEQLEQLPIIKYPFKLEKLPENGIYFFYEKDEIWGHGKNKLRIVRIGTHNKNENFRNRIKEHYLLDESKMNFDKNKPKPSDRSIFRKNIGRALIKKQNIEYLPIWEIDFTKSKNIKCFGNKRNIAKEKRIESAITKTLRDRFYFRFIKIDTQSERKTLERLLIGTVASCDSCKKSDRWLGNYSPKMQIKNSGLWLVQHLKANGIDENHKKTILEAIKSTKKWIKKLIKNHKKILALNRSSKFLL
ncbi:TPA: hypothetical protein DCG82_01725 [candidate division WOR-3]|nr:hypothetical protein [candidate division WOR-3 bacterium]